MSADTVCLSARYDQVPVTEHSFEDIVLQQEALAAGQSPETFQIELDKVWFFIS